MDARPVNMAPLLIAPLLVAPVAYGAPNLQAGFIVNDVKVYPDHKNPTLFYYTPRPLRLSNVNGRPAFRFDLFRYFGRKETGDSDVFRVRGVLTFEVERPQRLSDYQALKLAVQRSYPRATLRPAPITKFESKLIYSTVEPGSGQQRETGAIEGGVSKAVDDEDDVLKTVDEERSTQPQEGHWKRRRFTIGLQPRTAELFWKGFEQNNLLLSLAYSSSVRGVSVEEKIDGEMREDTVDLANTLPIDVFMRAHPGAFERTDIGLVMGMGHTTLTVVCYDFINEIKPHLYSVKVEVMFRTLREQDYIERVKFIENDDNYEKEVSFRLAKNLKAGYQFRVHRIFKDGRDEKTAWQQHNEQQLDVTYYIN